MPEQATDPRDTRIRSYVHQRVRLSDGQESAWRRLWPVWGGEIGEIVGSGTWDPHAAFGRTAPVLLEIGSGMGETTALLAAAEPGIDHVAVEVYEPGLAQLLMRVEQGGLANQRLLRGDAVELLQHAVAPRSLDGLRIFFPDPWPKRRHHKRRLIQPEFVQLAVSRLVPGGLLHLATDWPHYAEQMRRVVAAEPDLRPDDAFPVGPDGWQARPGWRPVTKFEDRAQEEGRPVRDLLYVADHGNAPDDIPRVTDYGRDIPRDVSPLE
ncbi:tRNA (guanine-N7)-methyltransferase [Pseudonocardia sp. EC080610-09]|uniref:tRNA (guanosine(46)-N7)-methyltransferase TrmB n=1 Tax=unclassified Pseudonocardia TaxID=2619320 RepID=UPI0006CB6DB7|nr:MULTISPECIES: tRNA (guanosine(46)-N7)-methyltransferase TrmB [unclassified Pseudonocardia]ALE75573.1 tRNA (guanine-N7)-methyltransferase [Pseudonocardia sp. EC080625-04]ALL74948.1 tRNA (guanine-N7)-methyltransferase [Pseudonocardia sp. EC080610-09]ALL81970.1 tRNA (guanine-N7)-methyltransferase [Pseudonocardia sp. EC080619-01]